MALYFDTESYECNPVAGEDLGVVQDASFQMTWQDESKDSSKLPEEAIRGESIDIPFCQNNNYYCMLLLPCGDPLSISLSQNKHDNDVVTSLQVCSKPFPRAF